VANKINGEALPDEQYPLRVVGEGLSGRQMVSMLTKITLLDLPTLQWTYLPLVYAQP